MILIHACMAPVPKGLTPTTVRAGKDSLASTAQVSTPVTALYREQVKMLNVRNIS